jgi:outer membrane receptor protein involved in Fe transport
VNYSQTVARPSFRELAAYYAYDPIVDEFVEGNPLLKMSSIRNYDLRWEWFARPGEVYSASLFYKDLQNAIERGNQTTVGDVITYFNRQQATLYGVELEARKNLGFLGAPLAPFTLGGNLSLVQSEVQLTPEELAAKRGFFPDAPGSRPLYDQSPYVANVDLSYTHPRSGPSASLIFNLAGPRITLAKLNTQDVYEQPALALDFVLSQKIGRHSTLKFSIRNLLDPSFERTYGKNSGLLYSSQKKGWTLGLTWTYDF